MKNGGKNKSVAFIILVSVLSASTVFFLTFRILKYAISAHSV